MFRIACIPALCLLLACGGTNGDEITVTEVVKTDEELRREAIESQLSNMLNDPSKYEFVSLDISHVWTIRTGIEGRRDWATMTFVPDAEKQLLVHVLDSLTDVHSHELDKITAWTYVMKYRDTNAVGALVLNETYVLVANDPPNYSDMFFTTDMMETIYDGGIPNWSEVYGSVVRRLRGTETNRWSVLDEIR